MLTCVGVMLVVVEAQAEVLLVGLPRPETIFVKINLVNHNFWRIFLFGVPMGLIVFIIHVRDP